MSVKVQFTKDTGAYLKGQVLTVDDASAKSLIGRKVAEEYDPKKKGAEPPVAAPRRPGVVHVAVVADANYPEAPEAAAEADSAAPAAPSAPASPAADKAPTK